MDIHTVLPFAIRFIIASGLLMALYWLMWRKQATYTSKRFYLLTMPIVALGISLIQIEVYKPAPEVITIERSAGKTMTEASKSAESTSIDMQEEPTISQKSQALFAEETISKESSFALSMVEISTIAYICICLGLMFPFAINYMMMRRIRKQVTLIKKEPDEIYIFSGKVIDTPFSFAKNIFLPENLSETQLRMVLTHERSHIMHRHYQDVWVTELVTRLLWWNPFLWWARTELRNVHEFEADSDVLATGEDVSAYQTILIEEVMNGDIVLANGFNHSFIRRRFIEMIQTTNRRMSTWAKAGSMAWICLVVALMCCTVGEAETIYRTVMVDAPQPVVEEAPFKEAEVADEVKKESLLSQEDMSEDVPEVAPDDTIKNIFVTKVVNGEVITDSIAILNKEHSAMIESLFNTLSNSIAEITPEQYEELQKYSQEPLPDLEFINRNIKKINEDVNSQFINSIGNLQSQLLRTQMRGLVNSGLADSKNITNFSVSASNENPIAKPELLERMVMDYLMEWLIINREMTEEEYNQMKNSSPHPELVPSLEYLNENARKRRIERTTFYAKQIAQVDENVFDQLLKWKTEYGTTPGNRDLEFTIIYPHIIKKYQKSSKGINAINLRLDENNNIIEHSFSQRIEPASSDSQQIIIPTYEKAIKDLRQAKENEFVIEGFVADNITDSCYNIYIGDKYLNIDGDNPVTTVPVVNKRFTYVVNLDKMTSGRVRCIFPDGKLCDNWIGIHFVPGETVILNVFNGFYDIETSPAYKQKVSKAIDALRKETNWKTPYLPKIKGKKWKDVSHKDNGALIVKEVYFNDQETVLRLAGKNYARGMTISENACLVDEDGNRYRFKRAITGNVNENNEPAYRVFGVYFAFEPMPKDTKKFTFKDNGLVVERIREAKK